MKWQAFIVLAAIVLAIFAPPALPLLGAHGASAQIGTLDLCSSGIPALAANGEMPCISHVPALQCPTMIITFTAFQKPVFVQFLFTFDNERPPRA